MSIVKEGWSTIDVFPDVDLNDTDKVRHKIISMVDDYFEYDFSDNEQRANAIIVIDDIFRCFYKNGFFTYDYGKDEMDRIKKDAVYIITKTQNDEKGGWRDLHSEKVFDSHPGSFVIVVVRHMLYYSNKTGLHVLRNKYWSFIARKVTRLIMG